MKDLNSLTQAILAVDPGEESVPLSTITEVREGPGQTIKAYYFTCNGLHCCLSFPVDESAAKLRNFFPKVSVHVEGEWLNYDEPEDWDLRATVWGSDPEMPNPVLLAILQDRVERVLQQYPTQFHRFLKTVEGHFGQAVRLFDGRAYPAQKRRDALHILTGVMRAKHLLRDMSAEG